jgi:hypothetical protein
LGHFIRAVTASNELSDGFMNSLLQVNPAASCDEKVLSSLHSLLCSLEPAALFADWASLGHRFDERRLQLNSDDVVNVNASPAQYSNLGALRVLQPDHHYWGSKPKMDPTFWCMTLRAPVALSSLLLHWHKTAIPDEVEVLTAPTDVRINGPADATPVLRVAIQLDEQNRTAIALPNVLHTTQLVLQFHGYGRENSKQQHKLEMVELFSPANEPDGGGPRQRQRTRPARCQTSLPFQILRWLRDADHLASLPDVNLMDQRAAWLLTCMVDICTATASGRLVTEILQSLLRQNPSTGALAPHLAQSLQRLVEHVKRSADRHQLGEDANLLPLRRIRAVLRAPASLAAPPSPPPPPPPPPQQQQQQQQQQNKQEEEAQKKRFVRSDAGSTVKCVASAAADDTVFIPMQFRSGSASWEFEVQGPSAHLISYGLADTCTLAVRKCSHALFVSGAGGSTFAEGDKYAAEVLKPLPRLNSGDRVRLSLDVEAGQLSVCVNGIDLVRAACHHSCFFVLFFFWQHWYNRW